MSLFQKKEFISHSGNLLDWKIDCDALSDEDITALAYTISRHFSFKKVVGIPRGGERLAEALEEYENEDYWATLVIDDVMTTGASMEDTRLSLYAENTEKHFSVLGIVIFSRMVAEDCPSWIYPVFQIWALEDPKWLDKTIKKDMESREKI